MNMNKNATSDISAYCKNCKYWILDTDDEYNCLIFPYRPDKSYNQCETEEEAALVFGCRVRRCRNPKLLFYQRPEKTGAAVMDGSEYRAELITGEDFGCVGFNELFIVEI